MSNDIIVFTDGAASGNPGPGGWGVVIVWPDGRVVELGGGEPHTTNNRMELTGAIAALQRIAGDEGRAVIYTDSGYVQKGITEWVWGWQRRGWKTATGSDVLNRDLWTDLVALVTARGRSRISWRWVRGHDGTPGNERVDQIAVAFSRGRAEALYSGPLSGYGFAVLDLPDAETTIGSNGRTSADPVSGRPTAPTASSRSKAAAHSYLSVVDGVLQRHATWSDCERRVKGQAGAKFRKAISAADEAAILRTWGFDRS